MKVKNEEVWCIRILPPLNKSNSCLWKVCLRDVCLIPLLSPSQCFDCEEENPQWLQL